MQGKKKSKKWCKGEWKDNEILFSLINWKNSCIIKWKKQQLMLQAKNILSNHINSVVGADDKDGSNDDEFKNANEED